MQRLVIAFDWLRIPVGAAVLALLLTKLWLPAAIVFAIWAILDQLDYILDDYIPSSYGFWGALQKLVPYDYRDVAQRGTLYFLVVLIGMSIAIDWWWPVAVVLFIGSVIFVVAVGVLGTKGYTSLASRVNDAYAVSYLLTLFASAIVLVFKASGTAGGVWSAVGFGAVFIYCWVDDLLFPYRS